MERERESTNLNPGYNILMISGVQYWKSSSPKWNVFFFHFFKWIFFANSDSKEEVWCKMEQE